MAWNEPDNNDGKDKQDDPWGSRRPGGGGNDQGPPDLEELISSIMKKLSVIFGGKGSGSGNQVFNGGNSISGGLVLGVITILAIIWPAPASIPLMSRNAVSFFALAEPWRESSCLVCTGILD